MAQQAVVRSIPDYPFKVPDKEITAWSSSVLYGTVLGAIAFATGIIVGPGNASGITTGNYFIPNFSQTFSEIIVTLVGHVSVNGETLRLAKPILARITHRDNELFCQNEELGIVAMSSSLEDCIKDFKEEILFVWNEYGKASDDILTDGAKELKRRIRQYVAK